MANTTVNYDDERFTQIEADKNDALTELEQTYGGMVNESDKYYQAQIDASKEWADKQAQLQQEQTDFTIEQVEQQKDKAHKDYLKEQSGAYVDWRKQSNQYGTEAEKMASAGLSNTGFSESSQVSMYNTYQNRVAVAREAFSQATLAYDNNIKEARLQNNAVLAEIYANAYAQQLELSLQGFQYENNLILEQANKKVELDNTYYNRYLDVLNQINTENAMAEEIRQYNESMAFEREQYEYQKSLMEAKSSSSSSSGKDSSGNEKEATLDVPGEEAIENKYDNGGLSSNQVIMLQAALGLEQTGKWGAAEQAAAKEYGATDPDTAYKLWFQGKLGKSVIAEQFNSKQSTSAKDIKIVNSPLSAEGAAAKVASGELKVVKQEGNNVWVAPTTSGDKLDRKNIDNFPWAKKNENASTAATWWEYNMKK